MSDTPRKLGRPYEYTATEAAHVMSLVGALSIRDIAKRTGMTAAKVQRIISRMSGGTHG